MKLQKYWRVGLEWKLQDLWIGVYWKSDYLGQDIWICLLPCLPIHIWSYHEAIAKP